MDFRKITPFLWLGIFYVSLSFLLRLVFIFHPVTTSSFSVFTVVQMLCLGLLNDILVFTVASLFLAVYLLFLSDSKYRKPYGYLIFGLFLVAFIYTAFVPGNIFKQYGGSFSEIAMAFVGLKTLFFGLLLFLPRYRRQLRNALYFSSLFLYVLLIIFNTVSEYFFWNEFGVRYNFIAVDYLIYTNEVIGNILESYPVVPLFSAILLLTVAVTWWIFKKTKDQLRALPAFPEKLKLLGTYLILFCLSLFLLPKLNKVKGENTFSEQIQANGLPKFYEAFTNKELDYAQFYLTEDVQRAEAQFLRKLTPPTFPRQIVSDKPELRKNVVLISIESLSAEFLAHYGNTQNITPFLDSLAKKSLLFTNLYATGNRTVRGLEALTLCIPPTAGESVVKRKDNKNKFTTGSVFASKGYQVKYLYGGYSYFDNMEDFFKGNGYTIIDRSSFKPEEITFANVWGVADEDMAKKAINTMNADARSGKPFFHHWMTVSNHRPFTYPEGKIDIPADSKSREGGVKYTDYALRKFFEMARRHSWYADTVFVIVSDHCASSAGKTELPMDKYRIPGMIFSEGFVEPAQFSELMSQIDVMPTLFGLLNFNYTSKFLGGDVLKMEYEPRAYIATYQDLGYVKNNLLTVISPTRKVKQYDLEMQKSELPPAFRIFYDEKLKVTPSKREVQETVSAYQTTSLWLKEGKLDK